jgi:putative oxidoreductase
MKRAILTNVCVALLIVLFSYTAISKFLDHYRFVFQMRLSPLFLVKDLASFWGVFIPLLEIGIVVGLLFEITKKMALITSLSLLFIFELYIVAMLLTGLKLPCSCGGVIAFMSWRMHILFNAIFIIINIAALKSWKTNPNSANAFQRT